MRAFAVGQFPVNARCRCWPGANFCPALYRETWPGGAWHGVIRVMSLPVALIIPTRNCRDALARHLDAIGPRLDEVAEVIAVDSESTDGTRELLAERLAGCRGTLLSHPPGLYESWNAAIARTSAKWTYFSTISDTIDPGGLDQLVDVASRLEADVVVSPPEMMQQDGVTPADVRWPVHHVAAAMGEHAGARLLSRLETVIALCGFGTASLLGSSAGNLYRTEFLRARPFPVEFGHAGDTGWALRYCTKMRLAVLPRSVSRFCLGWEFKDSDPRHQRDMFLRLGDEALAALGRVDDDPDMRFARGWLEALLANKRVLWDWLASQADLVRDHQELRAYLATVEEQKARSLRERIKRLVGR